MICAWFCNTATSSRRRRIRRFSPSSGARRFGRSRHSSSDQLIAIGALLAPAIETVVTHHLTTGKPVIIEGDGILPSLFERPALGAAVTGGWVRGVFLTATAAHRRANLAARGERSGSEGSGTQQRAGEAMNSLYDDWIGAEATSYGVPLVAVYPQATLADRICATLGFA